MLLHFCVAANYLVFIIKSQNFKMGGGGKNLGGTN